MVTSYRVNEYPCAGVTPTAALLPVAAAPTRNAACDREKTHQAADKNRRTKQQTRRCCVVLGWIQCRVPPAIQPGLRHPHAPNVWRLPLVHIPNFKPDLSLCLESEHLVPSTDSFRLTMAARPKSKLPGCADLPCAPPASMCHNGAVQELAGGSASSEKATGKAPCSSQATWTRSSRQG